jgi:hypothetical protein
MQFKINQNKIVSIFHQNFRCKLSHMTTCTKHQHPFIFILVKLVNIQKTSLASKKRSENLFHRQPIIIENCGRLHLGLSQ